MKKGLIFFPLVFFGVVLLHSDQTLNAQVCVPKTCAQLGFTCGTGDDTCGGTVDCGDCPDGESCNEQHLCVGVCVPKTCVQLGFTCGTGDDTCGGTVDCGDCPGGEFCDAQHLCANCNCDDGNPCTNDSCDGTGECSHDFDMCKTALDDACPCGGPSGGWKNHGQYVSCVAHFVNQLRSSGFISGNQGGAIVSQAAQSTCGK